MKKDESFYFSTGVIAYPIFFLILIWTSFWLQIRFVPEIKYLGIIPGTTKGLIGILLSPFIHSDISHLYNNSIPLVILSMALFYFYRPIAWKVLVFGILISGIITWVIGRPANHIGASGLIYVLVSFIFFKGVITKYYRLIALSLGIVFIYGSMIWYVFPIKEGMSWEGHLAGLITGFVFALIFNKQIAQKEKYDWENPDYNSEEDEFLKHFDENGNFIESIETKDDLNEQTVIYHYKKESD